MSSFDSGFALPSGLGPGFVSGLDLSAFGFTITVLLFLWGVEQAVSVRGCTEDHVIDRSAGASLPTSTMANMSDGLFMERLAAPVSEAATAKTIR